MTRGLVLAALVMALIAVFANVKVRYDQGQIWKANPEITEIAGAMSFSTADAPYFLGHAAAAERGRSPDEYERKRSYPNAEIEYQQRGDDAAPTKRPLLSTLIVMLSPSASPGDLLTAGHTILIVSAGVTAVMIILAFGATGYWLEGAVAAIGGGLSSAYLVRSSFGRIDTDQLNLGIDVSDVRPRHAVSTIKNSCGHPHLGCCGRRDREHLHGLVWQARIDLDGDCRLCLAACRAAQGFKNRCTLPVAVLCAGTGQFAKPF